VCSADRSTARRWLLGEIGDDIVDRVCWGLGGDAFERDA
jgi:hypothetical protein